MHITEGPRTKSPGTEHELLEELLTYDDLFLETFNAFLALPAFPLRLHYDRLTGRLLELDGFLLECPSQLQVGPSSPCYGATDTEREKALRWLVQERFLPFQRTLFYLEYKLAKLLICPLDEKYPGSRYAVRGYSRQSDSAAISSIPSHSSTEQQPTGVPSQVLLRLPSQTRSTPACLGHFASSSSQISSAISLEFPGVLSLAQSPIAEHLSRQQLCELLRDSNIQRATGRVRSVWANASEPLESPVHLSRAAPASLPDQEFTEFIDDYGKPFLGPRKILQFDLKETSSPQEGEGDSCLSNGFGNAALQQLKEDILGTRAGMDSFREFLHGTLGIHLFEFWIDCEDIMEHTRHMEKARTVPQETQLFFFSALRSIQAKYKLMLPPACRQLDETTITEETAFAALSKSQYDALRRLRSYWVPRFLIHHQRTRQLSSGFPIKEECVLSADFLFSLNTAALLPVMGDQRDMMSNMERNNNWRMQFRKNGICGIGLTKPLDLPADPFETLTTTRFLQVLMCDLGEGDGFLHYLTRFEDPQKSHNLLLWRKLKLYEVAWEQQASQSEIHHLAWQIFQTFMVSYAGCNTGLSSIVLEYIQDLERMLSFGSEDLKPSTFEPVIPYVLAVLDEMWLCYLRHEITTFLEYCVPESHIDIQSAMSKDSRVKQEKNERIKKQRQKACLPDQKGRGRFRKRSRKKAASESRPIGSADQETAGERSPSPQDAPDLLSNTVVLNVYRKAAHKMQDVELQRVLELLQEVEACQDGAQSEKHLDCATRLLDIWEKPGAVGTSVCFPKELKMRLKEEVAQGRITDFSWNEIRLSLHSFVAPAFEWFWDEVSEGLKKHGVQPSQIPEERWGKLEPFLHSIAAKVALRHLRSRKAQVGSAAKARPGKEDKTSFWQSLRKAAEGWPTIEMLHFLKHLQVHGSPVLESALHFLLEVQKFKNAHHAWPDMALLKKKVLVIRDCFLTSQIEPRLQVAVDTRRLGRAIQAAEQALQKEIPVPPPSLFDELKDTVFNILLPYWAAFQKHWLKRSPASAQKAPGLNVFHGNVQLNLNLLPANQQMLRNQLLLQKRQAMHERGQSPPEPIRLPPLQRPRGVQGSRCQDGFTYNFSISEGLILQDMSKEVMNHSKTSSSVLGNRKGSTAFQFPSLRNVRKDERRCHYSDPKTLH
ncbi:uncharacterized protein LOC133383691 isoform X2 [Rhineura floridana]|uniref:uncharacterized protein LOC133383691 isoform X2 n=1 Tax=Rhineura floridana TaxID=261503 RepID=UPI002AC880D8|nr:uncharacterized protein LOC133383691 isoform X2 [Rhineura floridana]